MSRPSDGNFIISVAKPQLEATKRLSGNVNRGPRGSDMDPDYRDYFTRPRGEFLTRGAALASAQTVPPEFTGGTPVGSNRGSLASHLDSIGVNANGVRVSQTGAGGMNTVSMSRLQAAAGKEKYGERRNPTILRKSNKFNTDFSSPKYF